jgi:hypothetical protein
MLIMLFAYSCSSSNAGYGDDDSVRYGSFTDPRDTMEYRTIVIGGQTWMADNLNFDDPAGVCEPSLKACENGRAYNWAVAMALDVSCNSSICKNLVQQHHRGICPAGWHIPSNAEWEGKSDKSFHKDSIGFVWWSADESDVYGERDACIWHMPIGNEDFRKDTERKIYIRSVRCVKD